VDVVILSFVAPAGASTALGARPAGFFIRVLAAIVDLTVLLLLSWGMGLLFLRVIHPTNASDEQDQLMTLFLTISAIYSVGFSLKWGGTPGKLLLGMRVIPMRGGAKLTWHQALARWASYLLSVSVFGAGFLMAAFHPLKRTLHDLMAGTRVVRL